MWFIGVEVEQETSAPPPKINPGSAPVLSKFDKSKKSSYSFSEPSVNQTLHLRSIKHFRIAQFGLAGILR